MTVDNRNENTLASGRLADAQDNLHSLMFVARVWEVIAAINMTVLAIALLVFVVLCFSSGIGDVGLVLSFIAGPFLGALVCHTIAALVRSAMLRSAALYDLPTRRSVNGKSIAELAAKSLVGRLEQ